MAKTSSRTSKKVYVTSEGLKETREELKFLITTKRQEVADRIQRARDFGDLAENSEYDAAMEEQSMLESRISQLENIIKDAQIIEKESKNDFVVIGSTVKVDMDGSIDEFTIVGKVEANPAKKRISNESPVGSALLGAKKGETVEVATPIVRYKCKILEIK
jgi:transcription elongation factor GreA